MNPLSKNSENYSMDGDIKALMDGSGESTENIVRPVSFLPAELLHKTIKIPSLISSDLFYPSAWVSYGGEISF